MLQVVFKAKKDSKGSDLKCNANILPILISYFMNFRVRIHQNGYLKRKRRQSTKKNTERKIGGFAPTLGDLCGDGTYILLYNCLQ